MIKTRIFEWGISRPFQGFREEQDSGEMKSLTAI